MDWFYSNKLDLVFLEFKKSLVYMTIKGTFNIPIFLQSRAVWKDSVLLLLFNLKFEVANISTSHYS